MLISPLNRMTYNYNQTKTISKPKTINFLAAKHLQPIDPNSFKSNDTKTIYEKIKKYLRIIGNSGKVENVPLNKTDDIFLSIKKDTDRTNMHISTSDPQRFIDATFNKDGQMTLGDAACLHFERSGKNKRIIRSPYGDYTPQGIDDRRWGVSDVGVVTNNYLKDPLFELFLEFARLYTSIYK